MCEIPSVYKSYEKYFLRYEACHVEERKNIRDAKMEVWKYDDLRRYSWTVVELNKLKKHLGVKAGRKKETLLYILFNVMRITNSIRVITRVFRRHLVNRYVLLQELKGGYVNDADFESLENMAEIKDIDKMVVKEDGKRYVFRIRSVERLRVMYKEDAFNPYTRALLDSETRRRVCELVQLRKVLEIKEEKNEPVRKSMQMKVIEVFQQINNLGNYADPVWLESLCKRDRIKYVKELQDIWEYRANLSNAMKSKIYARGDPFYDISIAELRVGDEENALKIILRIIKRLTNSVVRADAVLGGFYVLGALTLVSDEAAQALPWLHQSMYYSQNNNG
tara:strand:- start:182 stop:1186 length:1005 start_codon:yes stop_codon:yes gene_type:complete